MTQTKFRRWGDPSDDMNSGVELGGLDVTWAEMELATDRFTAAEIGATDADLDAYELDGGDYRVDGFRQWVADNSRD